MGEFNTAWRLTISPLWQLWHLKNNHLFLLSLTAPKYWPRVWIRVFQKEIWSNQFKINFCQRFYKTIDNKMVSFSDALNYVAYKNPVSQMTIAGVGQLAKATVSTWNDAIFIFEYSISGQFLSWIPLHFQGLHTKPSHARSLATKVVSEVVPISKQLGSSYHLIRVAALSGAAAVCLAAYGRHSMKDTAETKEFRSIYESASNIHFIHSIALLATPLTKRPFIVIWHFHHFCPIHFETSRWVLFAWSIFQTGSLFITGMILFSGTCYYKAIKKSKGESVEHIPAQLAPYGGTCLILGWLSMLF